MTILVSTDAWLDELRTRLPGISEGQLDLELKSTLREFFTKSGFWVEELDPISIVNNTTDYTLSSADGVIMGVQAAWKNGVPLPIATIEPKTENPNTGRAQIFPVESNVIRLFPTPTEDDVDALKVLVRMNPNDGYANVPSETVSHFFDEVTDGVLGRLYGQPGKPYTNLIQSQYHLRRFRDGMALARDMGRLRYAQTNRPWAFPQWA